MIPEEQQDSIEDLKRIVEQMRKGGVSDRIALYAAYVYGFLDLAGFYDIDQERTCRKTCRYIIYRDGRPVLDFIGPAIGRPPPKQHSFIDGGMVINFNLHEEGDIMRGERAIELWKILPGKIKEVVESMDEKQEWYDANGQIDIDKVLANVGQSKEVMALILELVFIYVTATEDEANYIRQEATPIIDDMIKLKGVAEYLDGTAISLIHGLFFERIQPGLQKLLPILAR